jgi:hypothetical protein
MYLIDPEGQFQDYFGQNKTPMEIADGIRVRAFKKDFSRK